MQDKERKGIQIENEEVKLLLVEEYMILYTDCWRRQWHPTPVLLPGKSHGGRSLGGYSPRGHRVRHD